MITRRQRLAALVRDWRMKARMEHPVYDTCADMLAAALSDKGSGGQRPTEHVRAADIKIGDEVFNPMFNTWEPCTGHFALTDGHIRLINPIDSRICFPDEILEIRRVNSL